MTGQKKLVDTNVILRYLLCDEPSLYKEAKTLFEKVRTGEERVVVLESVLVECIYVLTKFYSVPKMEASDKLKNLLYYKGISNNDQQELIEALALYRENKIDFVDCILCAKAKSGDLVLFTFDKGLKKLSGL